MLGGHVTVPRKIEAVDTHVCGEPGRVIVGGVPDVPGETMFEKMKYLRIGKIKALLPGQDNVKGRTRPVNLRSHASVGDQACAQAFAMLEWDERIRRWAAVGERDEPSNQRE